MFPENPSASTAGKKFPRSVSVAAKTGSSLAKSAPVQIPDPMRRSYSLTLLRERMSDGEITDGMCLDSYHAQESFLLVFTCGSLQM